MHPHQRGNGMIDINAFTPHTIYTIYIVATPEQVWQALTTAEFSREYFSGFGVELEEHVGGRFVLRAPDGSEHISGEVLVCERPKRLSVTFNVNWPGLVEALGQTLVSYDIEEAGDAVGLTMTESGERPIDEDIRSGGATGWPAILSGLKSLLETGKALAIRMEPPARMLAALKRLGIKTPE
jgi:uncharacterized protein YndB with AHSA1/START domain